MKRFIRWNTGYEATEDKYDKAFLKTHVDIRLLGYPILVIGSFFGEITATDKDIKLGDYKKHGVNVLGFFITCTIMTGIKGVQ